MTEIKEIKITTIGEPAHITLTRGQKGGYGWEISIYAETAAKADEQIQRIDALYKERYGGT